MDTRFLQVALEPLSDDLRQQLITPPLLSPRVRTVDGAGAHAGCDNRHNSVGATGCSLSSTSRLARSVSATRLWSPKERKVKRGQEHNPHPEDHDSLDSHTPSLAFQTAHRSSPALHLFSIEDGHSQELCGAEGGTMAAAAVSAPEAKLHKGDALEGRVWGGRLLDAQHCKEDYVTHGRTTCPDLEAARTHAPSMRTAALSSPGAPSTSLDARLSSLDSSSLHLLDRAICAALGSPARASYPTHHMSPIISPSGAFQVIGTSAAEGGHLCKVRPLGGSLPSDSFLGAAVPVSMSRASSTTLFELAEEQVLTERLRALPGAADVWESPLTGSAGSYGSYSSSFGAATALAAGRTFTCVGGMLPGASSSSSYSNNFSFSAARESASFPFSRVAVQGRAHGPVPTLSTSNSWCSVSGGAMVEVAAACTLLSISEPKSGAGKPGATKLAGC